MKIALSVLVGLVVLVVVFVVWRYIAFVRGSQRHMAALLARIAPVIDAIQDGGQVPRDQIERLARRPDTRALLYRVLHEHRKPELFPKEYSELARIAESDLVMWLLHPNELGAVPANIELVKVVEREGGEPPVKHRFFVFKFRSLPPHWAARDGWMAGVAGPYPDGEEPLCSPPGVFSRFEAFDSAIPEEHLRRVEELVRTVR